jgi:hypothetical protein
VGPFARQAGKDPLEGLGGAAKARFTPGQEVTSGGKTLKVAALDPKYVQAKKGWVEDLFGVRRYSAKCAIDVLGPIGRQQNSITYYYAVLHTPATRVVVPEIGGGSGIRAWIGGVPAPAGSKLRLAPGYHPLVLEVELGTLPPFVTQMAARFFLRDIPDPNRAYPEWQATIREARPRLEEILREVPGTDEARSAALLLRYAEEEK